MPFALREAGFGFGIILIFIMGGITGTPSYTHTHSHTLTHLTHSHSPKHPTVCLLSLGLRFSSGCFIDLLLFGAAAYSIKTLIHCGLQINKPNYQDLVLATYGKIGFNLLSFGQFFFPFFGMIAYSIIVYVHPHYTS